MLRAEEHGEQDDDYLGESSIEFYTHPRAGATRVEFVPRRLSRHFQEALCMRFVCPPLSAARLAAASLCRNHTWGLPLFERCLMYLDR